MESLNLFMEHLFVLYLVTYNLCYFKDPALIFCPFCRNATAPSICTLTQTTICITITPTKLKVYCIA